MRSLALVDGLVDLAGFGEIVQRLSGDLGGGGQTGLQGDCEPVFADFDKIDTVAGLEMELLSDLRGKCDATVEGDHSGGHLEPLGLL